jgi:hypothetical protein
LKKREVKKLELNGDQLPWVEKALHLGNTLTTQISNFPLGMDSATDLLQKRATFFQKVHELKQSYGFYDPNMICEIISIFGLSFYGSPLWNLSSEEHQKLNRSWNTVIKMVWDLPFATHKRFLESMTSVPHLQSTLQGRYIGFVENLRKSEKNQLQVLVNLCHQDQSSNTGQNIAFLMDAYESDTLNSLINKKHNIKKHRINPLEEGEEWKIEMLKELSLAKLGFLETDLEEADISTWLEIIATD